MMNKRIVSAILALVMLISLCPVFAADDYAGHWAKESIDKLISEGIVSGDNNGNINPDNFIKRSEFVKIINRKFNFTSAGSESFPDVSENAWYTNEFKIAKAAGYLSGDNNGNANPEMQITRAEVSVIIARVLKLSGDYSAAKTFADDASIPSWAKESIYLLNANGYINGYPDGSFKSQNPITRAESFTIIAKIAAENENEEDKKDETTENKTPSSGEISAGTGGSGGGGGGGGGVASGGNTGKEPENKDRTPEELKELNGNKEPEIEIREDSDIGLYMGVYSDVKVEDVDDAIASLKNVKTLLNIGDVSEEFVPFDDEGSKIDENTYKVQQVYNGVPVANAQTIISVNDEGYPESILNRYDDSVRLSGVNTTPSISEDRAKEIILEDLIAKDAEYTNGNVERIYLEIQADREILTYHAYVICDNSLGFNYYVDAHSGEVVVGNEIVPLEYDKLYYNDNTNIGSEINVVKVNETDWGNNYRFEDNDAKITIYDFNNSDVTNLSQYDDNRIYVLGLPKGTVWINSNDKIQRSAFYGIYTTKIIENIYSSAGVFNNNLPKKIAINIDASSSAYLFTRTPSSFEYTYMKYVNSDSGSTDVYGHEYTHFFQDFYINDNNGRLSGTSLGDACGTQIGSNTKWVEALAISEGTADIMGMLIESIKGETEFGSSYLQKDFWIYGENIEGKHPTANHYDFKHYDAWNIPIEAHKTVGEMNQYYKKNPNERYGKGPGHNERFILSNAFRKMVARCEEIKYILDDTVWFKLWGNAIKKLTPSSDFADMRLALISAVDDVKTDLGERHLLKQIIKAALNDVGITDSHNANENIAWYMPYVNEAVEAGILKADANNGFNYDKPMTRKELLTLVMKYAEISGVSDNPTSNINWAYSYGILNDNWLNPNYQNETIAHWEAARVIAGVLSHAKGNKKISYKPLYGADKNFDDFKNEMFKDWGASIAPDDSAIINLLNLNTNYSDYIHPKITNASQIQERYLKFCTEHKWFARSDDPTTPENELEYFDLYYHAEDEDAPKYNPTTANMLYYWGMYQLWQNGKFGGQSINGEKYLKITDQILCCEVCAILYK